MALTIAYDSPNEKIIAQCRSSLRIVTGTIAFSASYPTGGETFDLSNKVPKLKVVLIENKSGYIFEYDYANKKVKVYYCDYDAAGDGALIEVANATDLSALTGVRFMAIGYGN